MCEETQLYRLIFVHFWFMDNYGQMEFVHYLGQSMNVVCFIPMYVICIAICSAANVGSDRSVLMLDDGQRPIMLNVFGRDYCSFEQYWSCTLPGKWRILHYCPASCQTNGGKLWVSEPQNVQPLTCSCPRHLCGQTLWFSGKCWCQHVKTRDLIRVMPLTSRVVAKLPPDVLVMNVSCHYQPVFERCQGLATYRFYLQGNEKIYNHQTLPFLPILMESW